ncbi:cell wall-binding repeat-containing protein [Streptomyces sp. NBC_01275]|uniref:cell wall-binding repeat-containing protein n=1 Tax=Streptomyces sp. NBC_01275 TaxID=2903807 RepID=UPI002251FDE8|nr:cell wall-binding repeat-containing protein [Streptomyces sp. NBC_01275]MCX4764404.1 cell wall-binding repeat-containing protein [Streptomyces sp. NBC_01275]
MRLFTRRRAAALATTAVLTAVGALATAPGAAADDAGPWPGVEGRVLTDGGLLTDPATGQVTQIPNVASYATWAPDGSRLISAASQISSVRPNGTGKITLPWAQDVRSSASYEDLTFWWGGRFVVFSTGGQLAYGPSDGSWAPRPLMSASLEPDTVCDNDPTVSPTGLVAFERRVNYGCYDNAGVYVYDSVAKKVKRVLTDAEQPAYSPDGTKLAFVRHVDGLAQIFTAKADGADVKQITTGPRSYANPSWSPTGTRIVFDAHTSPNSDDVHTNEYVDLATGQLTKVADTQGANFGVNPSWQPLRQNGAGRVWGADAYATNIASSRWTWNTVGQSVPGLMNAKSAVLVNRDDPAYSVTAPALAGKKQGPVLMTPKTGLSSAVKKELKRAVKPGASVYLVGGTSILSGSVASQLKTLGYVPKRLSGADRYATSVAVAKSVAATPTYVFLAGGSEYRAALSAAAAAGADGSASTGSVVLTNGKKLTASVKAYLNSLNPNKTMIITVGSAAKYALTHTSYSRWPSTYSYYPIAGSGGTDAAISVAIAKFWWTAPSQTALAFTGQWRDGVSAAAAMNVFGPVLWTTRPALSSEVKSYLLRESASTNFTAAFGNTGAVTAQALNTVGASISAGSSYFDYRPYYNGVIPATAQASTYALRTNDGQAATVQRSAPVGADPHLDALKTLQHQ